MHEHDPSLPLAILNSLHEQIAFVNTDGVIEWVNHAWIRFGEENSPAGQAFPLSASTILTFARVQES